MRSWGIPHPPGTPLYVTMARAWSVLLAGVSTARAVGLFSAAATAIASAALALLVARATGSALMAFAAALCAGGMSTVWSSATEAEAYAPALLLAMGMLLAAERAGATGERRWMVLTVYALALSVPLHLSALTAAPAAIVLACARREGGFDRASAAALVGVTIGAAGAGRASAAITIVGGLLLAASPFAAPRERRPERARVAALTGAAAALALSAVAIMYLRAAHDPALNESDPRTLHALWETIGRRQFGSFSLWPRNAPLWLQFVQYLEYMDWQVALGIAPSAAPTVARTTITVVFLALGIAGARAHRAIDRRSWLAFATLFASASAGLVIYLNFFPGHTLGYGMLPSDVPHEVRERDYFFALSFWTWGMWAGIGAIHLTDRGRAAGVAIGVALAGLPLVLNWPAMDRSREPEASAPAVVSRALLWGVPEHAVLVTMGDHDSFLLWYAQIVDARRPDVTVAVDPLLYADWYAAQLRRREGLAARGTSDPLGALSGAARRGGRPLAFTIFTPPEVMATVGGRWMLRGLTFVAADSSGVWLGEGLPVVDTAAAAAFVREIGSIALPDEGAIDGSPRMLLEWVRCPAEYLEMARRKWPSDSLASRCKFR